MVKLFTDRRMLDHVTPHRHPERPERLQAIQRHLDRSGLLKSCESGKVREATSEELTRVHSAEYLAQLSEFESSGGRTRGGRYLGRPGLAPGGTTGGRRGHRGGLPRPRWHPPSCHVPRPPPWSSRPRGRADGLLHLQQHRGRGGRRHRPARAGSGPDRRLRRPSWQRDAGNLLHDPASAFLSIHRYPVLSGHRCQRDGLGKRAGLDAQCPPALWHARSDTAPPSARDSRGWPTGSPRARPDQRRIRCPCRRPGRETSGSRPRISSD